MALPKLNDNPSYSVVVPSTGKKVSFRPYLVKEEKVLMIAFETGKQNEMLKAVVDTIQACLSEKVDTSVFTTFDIEFLFTQIRSKSVGEKSTIMLGCSSCEHKNEVDIEISQIKIDVPKDRDTLIELTDTIGVKMKYPSYDMLVDMDQDIGDLDLGFKMVANCIDSIVTEEEKTEASDVTEAELIEFLESMTTEQFQKVSAFLRDMPTMKKEVKFLCEKCGEANERTLQGIGDFL